MSRLDFLTMREELMENVDSIVDELLPYEETLRDELVTRLCDAVCEIMEPAGLA